MHIEASEQFWLYCHRFRVGACAAIMAAAYSMAGPMREYTPWLLAAVATVCAAFLLLSALQVGVALIRVCATQPLRARQQASFDRLQIRREPAYP